jgi:hypothetical protein
MALHVGPSKARLLPIAHFLTRSRTPLVSAVKKLIIAVIDMSFRCCALLLPMKNVKILFPAFKV